nr:MAG TPA: hypothetical protein [Crassvirales sp.]
MFFFIIQIFISSLVREDGGSFLFFSPLLMTYLIFYCAGII